MDPSICQRHDGATEFRILRGYIALGDEEGVQAVS